MPVVINGTTGISGVDGSAGTPSYQGTDTNTGVFFPAADVIAFTTNGTEDMRIDSSGNVVIANNTARVRLDVRSDAVIAAPTPLANAVSSGVFAIGDSVGSVFGLQLNGSSYDTYIQARNMGAASTAYNLLLQPLGGNVGIGTSSPNTRLQSSVGSNGSGVVNALRLQNVGTTVGDGAKIVFTAGTSTDGAGIASTGVALDSADLRFYSGGNTERMRILSAGDVCIGTTSQQGSARLSVARSSAGECIRWTDGATGGFLGTIANVGIQLISGANLLFGSADAERMRIDNSGNLLVGTTATQNISGVNTDHTFIGTTNTNRWVSGFINNSASSPYGLAVSYTGSAPNATGNQFLFCRDTVGTRFEVRSNGGIANYSANDVNLSDEREKTNIQLAGSYLDKICAIPIKKFKYIDQNRETDDGLTLGVIAQDVQAVAPELVMESNWAGKDEPEKMRLSIYQTDLQYALMKCIQEQQAMIEELKAKVAALEK